MDAAEASTRARLPLHFFAVVALLVATGAWTIVTLPAPIDVAPETGFDTGRAVEHLRFIAREPRPLGAAHHRAVRDYLIEQFKATGLVVDVQDARVPLRRDGSGPRIEVTNVIARLPGAGGASTTHAVMLAAHYDSTHTNAAASRGAGDDGAAIAALLEVARVLTSDRPQNDVIFLITDGEERGLLGARAFVEEHPWFAHAGVVFNFEARGTSGPSLMFQTSPGNAWLVGQYARVAPHPVTSSIGYEIYRLLPNNTDFTVFRDAGMRGLNFAFIGDYHNYHRAGDNLDNLDVRSMRHHGVQALELARHFGAFQLTPIGVYGDAIFFNVGNLGVVRYPQRWSLPLAIGAAAASLFAVIAVARRVGVRARGVLWSLITLFVAVALATATSWALRWVIPIASQDRHADLATSGFTAIALLWVIVVTAFLKSRASAFERAITSLLVWTTLAVASAALVPAASYLFVWPALAGVAAVLVCCAARNVTLRSAVVGFTSLPLVLLLTPVTYLAFQALRMRLAPVVVIVIVLALWALISQFMLTERQLHAGPERSAGPDGRVRAD